VRRSGGLGRTGQSAARFRPRAVGVTDWGRPGNSGGNSSLSDAMLWVCGVELSGNKPRFAEPDQQMWVSPLLGTTSILQEKWAAVLVP